MRLSNYFAPTLREAPAEAEIISHKLLIRAGMIKKVAAGIYSFLPNGKRVLDKVENIIREEMNAAGAREVLMPVLQPADLWQKTGRWDEYGPEMMRVKDRNERDFALGPTHEELITSIVAAEVRSYKELPQNLYQIQVKFRDEIRPRFGLMRAREFIMKDAYSFHTSQESLQETYDKMSVAYSNIVKRCGLKFKAVKAEAGLIGGDASEEFMVLASTGEDMILYCNKCEYGANIEQAKALRDYKEEKEKSESLKEVDTPGKKSIGEVSEFLNVEPERLAKTLVYLCDSEPVLVVLPGDREANENKIKRATECKEIRLFNEDDFDKYEDLVEGYVGPMDQKYKIIVDEDIVKIKNMIIGANKNDSHLINVNYDRDFKAEIVADIKYACEGDICPSCAGNLGDARGIEVGHIFQLGTKYSEAMGATYVDENGKNNPMLMGCYGIGVTRMISAAIEQNHDEKGIIWPKNIAPFEVVIVQTDMKDEKLNKASQELYNKLVDKDFEVVYDDRSERAGVKFADADLIGYPIQIVFGKTYINDEKVELKIRDGHKKENLVFEDCIGTISKILR